jgi:hypothetical protein
VKSARLHKRPISCISVDLDGELTVLWYVERHEAPNHLTTSPLQFYFICRHISGADNGAAIVLTLGQEDFRDSTYSFNEPIKAVCLEPSGNSTAGTDQSTLSKRDEKAFLVGTSAGKLILQRPAKWFRSSQKEVVLFPGAGSAVTNITWERNFVAWADASQVGRR